MTRSSAEAYDIAIRDLFGESTRQEKEELASLRDAQDRRSLDLEKMIRDEAKKKLKSNPTHEVRTETAAIVCGMAPSSFTRKIRLTRRDAPLRAKKIPATIRDIDISGKVRERKIGQSVYSLDDLEQWNKKVAELEQRQSVANKSKQAAERKPSQPAVQRVDGQRRYLVRKDGVILMDAEVYSLDHALVDLLIGQGATLEVIGFVSAMTQRVWAYPAERRPWADVLERRLAKADYESCAEAAQAEKIVLARAIGAAGSESEINRI